MNEGWPGGSQEAFCSPVFCEFEPSLIWEFELFQEISKIHKLGVP